MLRGVNKVVSPDLVHALCAMGHGQTIAVVDANDPVDRCEARVIRRNGALATDIVEAILSLCPLETAHADAARRMIVDGDPTKDLPILDAFAAIVAAHEPDAPALLRLTPDDFKARAAGGYAIVQSGDVRVYGNILLKKGVVAA